MDGPLGVQNEPLLTDVASLRRAGPIRAKTRRPRCARNAIDAALKRCSPLHFSKGNRAMSPRAPSELPPFGPILVMACDLGLNDPTSGAQSSSAYRLFGPLA